MLIFCALVLVCCTDKTEKSCPIVENARVFYSHKIEFGYLDTNNIFQPRKPFIWDETTNIDNVYPITLRITKEKIITQDGKLVVDADSLYTMKKEYNGLSYIEYDPGAYIKFVDENCNELLNKHIKFYIKEEDEARLYYVATTQIAIDGKYVLGQPILFVDPEYYDPHNYSSEKEEDILGWLDKDVRERMMIIPASKQYKYFAFIRLIILPYDEWANRDTISVFDSIVTLIE
jgi:hypothetical protein